MSFNKNTFILGMLAALLPVAPVTVLNTPAVARQASADDAFQVTGAVNKPGAWTVARLRRELAADIKTVHYDLKGTKGQAQCVPLLTLVKASEPRLNPKVKNHLLAFTVSLRAKDGYTTSFSLGEMQPEVGKRDVWIALDRNQQPIPGDDGPVELVVPGDGKPSRWLHGIERIVISDGLAQTAPVGAK